MGAQNRHTIGKQVFQIVVSDTNKAFGLQQEVSKLFWENIVPALEQLFDQYANPDDLISIENLQLDLGFIPEKNWQVTFTAELLKKIEQVLNEQSSLGTRNAKITKQPLFIAQFQQWLHFLEFGYLPWNVSLNESVETLQKSALDTLASEVSAPGQLHKLLWQNAHAFDRLLLQHPEVFLKTLCAVFTAHHQDELLSFRLEWTLFIQETVNKDTLIPANIRYWIKEQNPERPAFFWKKILETVILEEQQLPAPTLISIFLQKIAPPNQLPLFIHFIKGSWSLFPEPELLLLKTAVSRLLTDLPRLNENFVLPAEVFSAFPPAQIHPKDEIHTNIEQLDAEKTAPDGSLSHPLENEQIAFPNLPESFVVPVEADAQKRSEDSAHAADPELASTDLGEEPVESAQRSASGEGTPPQTQDFIAQGSGTTVFPTQNSSNPAVTLGESQLPAENTFTPPRETFMENMGVMGHEENSPKLPVDGPTQSPTDPDDHQNLPKTSSEQSAEISPEKTDVVSTQAETPLPSESILLSENSLPALSEPPANNQFSTTAKEPFLEKTEPSPYPESTPLNETEVNFSEDAQILENTLPQEGTEVAAEGLGPQSSPGDESGPSEKKESSEFLNKSADSLSEDLKGQGPKADTAPLPHQQFESPPESELPKSTKEGNLEGLGHSNEGNLPGIERLNTSDQDKQSATQASGHLLPTIPADQVLKKPEVPQTLETFQSSSVSPEKEEKQFDPGTTPGSEHPNPASFNPEEQGTDHRQIVTPNKPNDPAGGNQSAENPNSTLPFQSENPIGADQREVSKDTPLAPKEVSSIENKISEQKISAFLPEEDNQLAQNLENAPTSSQAKPLPKPLAPKPALTIQEGANWFIQHAGIVLLHPFLPQFFGGLGLLDGKNFKDDAARHRAVHLLHYLATSETGLPEFMLLLPKILCGLPFEEPMERFIEFTDTELSECEDLLKAVIKNWGALGNASPAALREAFLNRDGKLEMRANGWHLIVERQTIDILLNKLPWGIGFIKLPWMEGFLQVEWN